MIDHISIGVLDLKRSVAFYDEVLRTLGYVRLWIDDDAAGYGVDGHDEAFAIKQHRKGFIETSHRSHIAFASRTEQSIIDFHATALAHGASDDGAPGVHSEYGPDYFAAFVTDPDGYRLEAVWHGASQ
jgi:catechol 2,3-dioxygenase-like lactoylglutathione lyase family enzyme